MNLDIFDVKTYVFRGKMVQWLETLSLESRRLVLPLSIC